MLHPRMRGFEHAADGIALRLDLGEADGVITDQHKVGEAIAHPPEIARHEIYNILENMYDKNGLEGHRHDYFSLNLTFS